MKRTLTILTVLTLLTGALFATDPYLPGGNTINLNATVAEVPPTFKLYGSMDANFTSYVEGGGTPLDTKKNPATENITAYFNITQENLTRYKGNLLVTFTGTPFTAKVGEDIHKTADPWVIINTDNGANGDYMPFLEIKHPDDGHGGAGIGTVAFKLMYKEATPIPAKTILLNIHTIWTMNGDLPATNYEATLSVKIETTT